MFKQNKSLKTKKIILVILMHLIVVVIFSYGLINYGISIGENNINNQSDVNNTAETLEDHNETIISDNNKKQNDINDVDDNKTTKPDIRYIYKNNDISPKEVVVEKEILVNPDDATITYKDSFGNTTNIKIPKGTTISFNEGEHGLYDVVPSPITLSENQQIDITDPSYIPSLVEINYIFKGFSYSGSAFKAEYQLASNTINVDVKKYNEVLIDSESIKYARSEYIENIDKQYINTGKTINNNSYFELKCSWTEIADVTSVLWGCIGSGSVNNYIRVRTNSGNYISTEFRRQMSSLTSGDVFPVKSYEIYTIKKDLSDLSHITVNDHTYTAPNSAAVNFPNENVYLFLESVGSPERHGKGRIYSYQIWTSNDKTSLSKDFVPAKRLSDNKYGLLELVENKFYFSPDGGNFKGNDILNNDKNAGIVIGSGTYDVGSDIELKAIANDGYIFSSWSDGLMEETRTISIGDTNTYSAIFVSN